MRTLSKKTKYGLRALYNLARKYGQGPILIATLSTEEEIPLKFLEAILVELKGASIVMSRKGKHGGYQLARDPGEITLGSVIRVLEGPLAPLPCASETAYQPCEECGDVALCGTRLVMRQVRDAIAGILDGRTLADVVADVNRIQKQRLHAEELMFYI